MIQIDEKQYARELKEINERLAMIEESIRSLLVAVESLSKDNSAQNNGNISA